MKVIKVIDRTLETAAVLMFLGVIGTVTIQILSRFLPYTAVWTEELTRFLFIYAIAFAAPLALKQKEFINVDILINLLPERLRQLYEAIIYLGIVVMCVVIAFQGYTFAVIGYGQRSATMALDMSIIHASIGVSVVFIALYALIHSIEHAKALQRRNDR